MTDYTWQPPTPESLNKAFQDQLDIIHSPEWQDDENNFPYLYDRVIGEDGERYEVLPGLFGKVSNYYVTHPGSWWNGSQVWINNGEFKAWYAQQKEQ